VILNNPLCEMNRMTIVPANEFFKLDALAVFSDLAEAILFHARNLGEFRRTHNLVFGLTRSSVALPDDPRQKSAVPG
jgi:hypothetical protein